MAPKPNRPSIEVPAAVPAFPSTPNTSSSSSHRPEAVPPVLEFTDPSPLGFAVSPRLSSSGKSSGFVPKLKAELAAEQLKLRDAVQVGLARDAEALRCLPALTESTLSAEWGREGRRNFVGRSACERVPGMN